MAGEDRAAARMGARGAGGWARDEFGRRTRMGGKEESVDEAGRQRRAETGTGGGRNVQGALFGISVCFWVKITTLRNRKIEKK